MPPQIPWRIGCGWAEPELRAQLAALATRRASRAATPVSDSTPETPWTEEHFEAPLGHEAPGPPLPDGLFSRVRHAIRAYRFADPRITRGRFDSTVPLLGRDILVEVRVLLIHMLVGLRIGEIIDRSDEQE